MLLPRENIQGVGVGGQKLGRLETLACILVSQEQQGGKGSGKVGSLKSGVESEILFLVFQ